jgi:hypothetical protein
LVSKIVVLVVIFSQIGIEVIEVAEKFIETMFGRKVRLFPGSSLLF